MRTLIIDNEEQIRIGLKKQLLGFCPAVTIIAEASGIVEGEKMIEDFKPDLVFIDIKMPYLSGFDVLRKIPNQNFKVIFTTAFNEFAIKAIRFSAFDYLLKPIDVG